MYDPIEQKKEKPDTNYQNENWTENPDSNYLTGKEQAKITKEKPDSNFSQRSELTDRL